MRGSGFRKTLTTSATYWETITGAFDFTILGRRLPKAIMANAGDTGNVVIAGVDGNQITLLPAGGVMIQVRPTQIISMTLSAIHVFYG